MNNYFDFERADPPALHEWQLRQRLERRNRRRCAALCLVGLLLWQMVYLAAAAWIYREVSPASGLALAAFLAANMSASALGAFIIVWKRRDFIHV